MSEASAPERRVRTARVRLARSMLWVTRTKAARIHGLLKQEPHDHFMLAVSRLPVGSSANRIFGSWMKAWRGAFCCSSGAGGEMRGDRPNRSVPGVLRPCSGARG